MNGFPVVSWHHFNSVPGTSIEKSAVGAFANTLLTTDAEVWIYFNSSKRRVVLVRQPEHTRFDRAILDARGRAGTAGTTIRRNREYAWPLLTGRFPVALRHRPVLFYDVEHSALVLTFVLLNLSWTLT